jgi:uncharacterized protein (DUF924 family)
MDDALRVRTFWFGKRLSGALPREGLAAIAQELKLRNTLWFGTDSQMTAQQDEQVRSEFRGLVERAGRGNLAAWADSPRRRLSLIILLDQFTRQIYRGTPQAFAHDAQALTLTLSGMESAADGALNIVERLFFYMPLQHGESTEAQEESVSNYRRLLAESPAELRPTFDEAFESAQHHRTLILQFGRFPHRNPILGRESTPEEEAYLKKTGERCGQ